LLGLFCFSHKGYCVEIVFFMDFQEFLKNIVTFW
jgi:hypothetical protein